MGRNGEPRVGATGLCVLAKGVASRRFSGVGSCVVGPISDERTSLRGPRDLGVRARIPARMRVLSKFVSLGRRKLGMFLGGGKLTVALKSLTRIRKCFGGARGEGPAVARVGMLSAC